MVTEADILHAKILIVDDLPANVMLLEQMLANAGYDRVSSTQESSRVCELHLLERYDLILLDLQMPEMDGFQVMENLKEVERGGTLPVLVITAQPLHKLKALKGGARDFVSKPFDLAEVLARVHNLIEARLLHDETRRLYAQVLAEQERSARLALAPRERPGAAPSAQPSGGQALVTGAFAEVTVLFAELLDLTRFSRGAGAEVLTGVLAQLTDTVDAGTGRQAVIDDAWLAASGLTDAVAAHTLEASEKAVTLEAALASFNARSDFKLQMRVGLETAAPLGLSRKKPRKARAR